MLSNLSCTAFPVLPDTTLLEEDLLNFDDLLDIAREYEFTRTITHLWSCEDDHSTLSETGLDDMILATISSPPNPKESPLAESMDTHLDPSDHVQEVLPHRLASASASPLPHAANPSATMGPVHLPQNNDDQIPPESGALTLSESMLRGWSPPDGSQFLDLDDDSLMFPQSKSQSSKDSWIPPWLPTCLPNTSQPKCNVITNQSLPSASETGNTQPQRKPPPEGSVSAAPGSSKKENVPTVTPSPVQPSKRTARGPARSRSALQPGASSTATHPRPPRGGIPPHIARSVTKANIIRVEKESQVIRDACSITTSGDGKKPSVLRGSTAVEGENGKTRSGCGSGSTKKLSDAGENGGREGRATKRARV